MPAIVGHPELKPPFAVEHVLQASGEEARADVLVVVVVRRCPRASAPVAVLILVVVFEKSHPAGAGGQHGAGADVEHAAAAGAGPAGACSTSAPAPCCPPAPAGWLFSN